MRIPLTNVIKSLPLKFIIVFIPFTAKDKTGGIIGAYMSLFCFFFDTLKLKESVFKFAAVRLFSGFIRIEDRYKQIVAIGDKHEFQSRCPFA